MANDSQNAAPSGRLRLPPAFHYPAYRVYWGGSLASILGFQVFLFSQFNLIHHLTGSAAFIGVTGAASAVPSIFLNLYGGVVADRMDRRRLLLATQLINAAVMALLGALTFAGRVEPWHVIAVSFVSGAVFAFDNPARQSLYPRLVAREALTSAVAFQSVIWQGTRMIGPGIAGLIVANVGGDETLGLASGFYFAAAGFFVMALAMTRLRIPGGDNQTGGGASGMQALAEGLGFIRRDPVVRFLILMSFANAFFGGAHLILMPAVASDVLGVGRDLQGWLLASGGAGALSVTLVVGTRRRVRAPAAMIIGGATLYGLLLAAFALTAEWVGSYPLALVLVLAMGVTQSAYMITIMSSLMMATPDHMRGRVLGVFGITYAMLPLSGLQAGILAEFIGVPMALAIGGFIVSFIAVAFAAANPKIRALGRQQPEPQAAAVG
ncbi:MAG: MFS transporter [Dehalococcoidia bacterium]|nr:MFS transporter [Dehalococcoidia bacterium]